MIYSASLFGVDPLLVEIEIDLSPGLPFFQIVGLPDEVLKESKTRVKSAIQQAGFEFPYDSRLVLNLAPSKVKKEGSAFELAIAAKILWKSGQIIFPEQNMLLLGELALDGSLRSTEDIETLVLSAEVNQKVQCLVLPADAAINLKVSKPVVKLEHLKNFTEAEWWIKYAVSANRKTQSEIPTQVSPGWTVSPFWAELLVLAAVGEHHLFLIGAPGSGKTFFAEALRDLRQKLGIIKGPQHKILDSIFKRGENEIPWAAPHHSATVAGLVGGGSPPSPGSVTKAHGGILYLDELLEFSPHHLDSLREPIEKGWVEIARAGCLVKFPCEFQLVATANPCRCGYWKHPIKPCLCSPSSRNRYQMKASGPLVDRFDLVIHCPVPQFREARTSENKILDRCREILDFKTQFQNTPFEICKGVHERIGLLQEEQMLSHRRVQKLKSVARTFALMDLKSTVEIKHFKKAQKLASDYLS